jgi:hypothetical protein
MPWPPFHEEHNHSFCPRRKHRRLECKRGSSLILSLKQIAQRDRTKTGAKTQQQIPSTCHKHCVTI